MSSGFIAADIYNRGGRESNPVIQTAGDILFSLSETSVVWNHQGGSSRKWLSMCCTISQDGRQAEPNLVMPWLAHVIIIALDIHYSPVDGSGQFVREKIGFSSLCTCSTIKRYIMQQLANCNHKQKCSKQFSN